MPARPVPLRAVTTLFLERQHLSRPRVLPLTTRRLLRFVEDAGGLQLDSIDLLERCLPGVNGCEEVSSEDFRRWHVERSLHAMGAATEQDLTGYLTFPRFGPGVRRAALRALLERGEVTELTVDGAPGRWYAL